MKYKYTDYCTTFYVPGEKKVYFYDEIKDKTIGKQRVKNKEEAEQVMKEYLDNAPNGIICHKLKQIHWMEKLLKARRKNE